MYSTCSIEAEENMQQVEWFLETVDDFSLEPAPLSVAPGTVSPTGCLCCFPATHGTDGAFAARLRRSECSSV